MEYIHTFKVKYFIMHMIFAIEDREDESSVNEKSSAMVSTNVTVKKCTVNKIPDF